MRARKMDLVTIFKTFRDVEYRPQKFPGLAFRLKRPKTVTLIFTTGKMVCTGAKSAKLARTAVRKVVSMLKKEGFLINTIPDIVVQNMVSSAYIGGNIDLEVAAYILEKHNI